MNFPPFKDLFLPSTKQDYLLSDPSGRSTDIPIVVLKQGFEPPNFTGFFGAWDPELLGVSLLKSKSKSHFSFKLTSPAATRHAYFNLRISPKGNNSQLNPEFH